MLALAACGGTPRDAASPLEALPRAAVPELSARSRTLDSAALVEATPLPGLDEKLSEWELRSAVEREFVGRSERFDHVVSRALEFSSPGAARAYAAQVALKARVYLGAGAGREPLAVGGWRGFRVTPDLCGCHGGPAREIAVLVRGDRVAWLDLSGRGVDETALEELAARAVTAAQAGGRPAGG